jgi:hypothetical protein
MTTSYRQYFINMHSIIRSRLPDSCFNNSMKYGFVKTKIINETIGDTDKPKYLHFLSLNNLLWEADTLNVHLMQKNIF